MVEAMVEAMVEMVEIGEEARQKGSSVWYVGKGP